VVKYLMSERLLLIIEDETDISEVMKDTLEDEFSEIFCCENVVQTLEHIEKSTFDCIILDINLDGENGALVLKHLQETPDNPNHLTPVIISSGFINEDFKEKNADRFAGIFSKPFHPDEFKANIVDLLGEFTDVQDDESVEEEDLDDLLDEVEGEEEDLDDLLDEVEAEIDEEGEDEEASATFKSKESENMTTEEDLDDLLGELDDLEEK